MAVISTPTKVKLAARAGRTAARNPLILKLGAKSARPAARAGWTIGKPIARYRARRRSERMIETARELGESLLTYGAEAAQSLGLIEAPKPKRSTPRVLAGAALGAAVVYFLEPGQGREHRRALAKLIS
jgi:hypothetical protein